MPTSMHEASFKLRHECPYRDVSEQFPDVTIREWHHQESQVLELSTDGTSVDDLLSAVQRLGTVLHRTGTQDGSYVIVQARQCPIDDTIIEQFHQHNCVYTPPTVYRDGWEHYTVIGFAARDIHDLLQELDASRDIDVLSKTAIEERRLPHSTVFSIDRLFAGLTDRQLAALRHALDHGYYDQPRGTSIAELAGRTDVARATFEEHLRKAENKLVTNVEQFVRVLTETQTNDVLGTRPEQSPRFVETD